MWQVIYTPKVEDEVVIAEFDTVQEAEKHMNSIFKQSPKAHTHHYIKEK
jgi:hypothetical protein